MEINSASVHYLYMANVPSNLSLQKHYIWQSPLLLPEDITDFNELDRRVRQAGMLWLKNGDMRPFNLLILTHKTAWISYFFQRSQAPNQHPVTAGPILRRMIRSGTPIPPYPIVFKEFTETINFEKLKREQIFYTYTSL